MECNLLDGCTQGAGPFEELRAGADEGVDRLPADIALAAGSRDQTAGALWHRRLRIPQIYAGHRLLSRRSAHAGGRGSRGRRSIAEKQEEREMTSPGNPMRRFVGI